MSNKQDATQARKRKKPSEVSVSLVKKQQQTAATKVIDLDLNTVSKSFSVPPVAQRAIAQAYKDQTKAIELFTTPQFQKMIGDMNTIGSQLALATRQSNSVVQALADAQKTSVAMAKIINHDLAKLNIAKSVIFQEIPMAIKAFDVYGKQLASIFDKFNDLRIVSSLYMDGFIKSAQILRNFNLDIKTIVGSVHISKTTLFQFDETDAYLDADELGLHTTAVQTRSNDLVTVEQHRKVDLLLTTSTEQREIITQLDGKVTGLDTKIGDVKAMVSQLVQQGKQQFSIRDIDYKKGFSLLKIGSFTPQHITAKRERQLCDLMLVDMETMTKRWTIEDMLELIGELYSVDSFDYGRWLNMFYMAAKRLNDRLRPILGIDLIIVDRSKEKLYVNPQFYHK